MKTISRSRQRRRMSTASKRRRQVEKSFRERSGQASMDYFLIIAIIIPMVTFLFMVVPRMIQLVYEMAITIVGSPLM